MRRKRHQVFYVHLGVVVKVGAGVVGQLDYSLYVGGEVGHVFYAYFAVAVDIAAGYLGVVGILVGGGRFAVGCCRFVWCFRLNIRYFGFIG